MTTEELEAYLEAGAETQNVEFKGPCDWNVESLAKDILALSNTPDGGVIVIGIEDKTFKRLGITPKNKSSYESDIMKDQMKAFADPHVGFRVEFVKDNAGLEYVAIRVSQFDTVPVICSKATKDTKPGTIYYRSQNRRPESVPVSNSYDMRLIVEAAAVRMMHRFSRLGLKPESGVEEKLDKELGGL